MATTTNFGWETPDDTDLVKDGALAMRTLGNAIDASLVDLKGGTTGQVLSKNSNTDMDFTWVTSDDANAIQNAIVDAKGDLITATAADTPARLAVGSNGDTLVADSAATTGLRWSGGLGLAQPIINGGMDIWQRGTSDYTWTTSVAYGNVDRFCTSQDTTAAGKTKQVTSGLPDGFRYGLQLQRNSGATSTGLVRLTFALETANSIPYAGKTITYSFWAKAGANFSAASSNLLNSIFYGTGTDQAVTSLNTGSWTGQTAAVSNQTANLTTSWQRFSITTSIPASATQIGFIISYTPVGTAGADDSFSITGLQIDVGSVALPFRRSGGTIQGELAACQRYYVRNASNSALAPHGVGFAYATTATNIYVPLPVSMRVAPTSVEYSTLNLNDGAANVAVTNLAISQKQSNAVWVEAQVSSGLTQFRPCLLTNNNNTAGYLAFSAEL